MLSTETLAAALEPLAGRGNFYPEYCRRNILPTWGNSVNVYGAVDDNLFTMTHSRSARAAPPDLLPAAKRPRR